MFLMSTRFLLTSSCAFSAFLSPRSSEATASLSAFTSSCGLFCDFPNSGIVLSFSLGGVEVVVAFCSSVLGRWVDGVLLLLLLGWAPEGIRTRPSSIRSHFLFPHRLLY
uniref:Putative secreted protein n=1 Tax=Anopheles marajoara TaxID=58244 RepID=A0A2M4C827_9DIPT